jgi:prephenate dehydrogenase
MEAHFSGARVLVAGLGLIGGSVAKALRRAGCAHLDGLDTDAQALAAARQDGVVGSDFHAGGGLYDLVICSLAPRQVAPLYRQVKARLAPGGVFAELSGLKSGVVSAMVAALEDSHELLCLHPMAGSEKSGYAHSDAALFAGAPLLLTPTARTGEAALRWAALLREALGGGDMPSVPADAHDALIADLSHLPHAVALAVRAVGRGCEAFAGGSYRSVTRVADINAPLWAGLLTDNAEYVLESIQKFRTQLDRLEDAVRAQDAAALEALLRRISAPAGACADGVAGVAADREDS